MLSPARPLARGERGCASSGRAGSGRPSAPRRLSVHGCGRRRTVPPSSSSSRSAGNGDGREGLLEQRSGAGAAVFTQQRGLSTAGAVSLVKTAKTADRYNFAPYGDLVSVAPDGENWSAWTRTPTSSASTASTASRASTSCSCTAHGLTSSTGSRTTPG